MGVINAVSAETGQNLLNTEYELKSLILLIQIRLNKCCLNDEDK